MFAAAGAHGMLLFETPERFGGAGVDDFRFNTILNEEFARSGYASAGLGLVLQNDVVAPYLTDLTTEGRRALASRVTSGELVVAIAMTEPGAGSDLSGISTRAVRDGDHYVIDGSKTFISNGQNCDLVVVAARTGEDRHRGLSLFVVEAGAPVSKGRNLDKLGLHGQDTSELSFTGARVPAANLLGEEGAASTS